MTRKWNNMKLYKITDGIETCWVAATSQKEAKDLSMPNEFCDMEEPEHLEIECLNDNEELSIYFDGFEHADKDHGTAIITKTSKEWCLGCNAPEIIASTLY